MASSLNPDGTPKINIVPAALSSDDPSKGFNASDRVVRICSDECSFINMAQMGTPKGCIHFQKKQVSLGEPCLYDIEIINSFINAHRNGDMSQVKDSVGSIIGTMMVQIYEMFSLISKQGLVNKEPILDGKGNVIRHDDGTLAVRYVENPLLTKVVQMCKAIGFDLSKFRLTPMTSGETPNIEGNIMLEKGKMAISDLIKQNKEEIKRFEEGALLANQDLLEDPVYKSMTGKKNES